ncbi:putative ribonuclease H-like domain-containing protein [Tanacetum coccineum]
MIAPVFLALMATNSEVPLCSNVVSLITVCGLENYQKERDNFSKSARTEILDINELESLEVMLKHLKKIEYAWVIQSQKETVFTTENSEEESFRKQVTKVKTVLVKKSRTNGTWEQRSGKLWFKGNKDSLETTSKDVNHCISPRNSRSFFIPISSTYKGWVDKEIREDLIGTMLSLTVDAPGSGRISGKGTIKTSCLDFEKVSYVEELKFNLLSVSQICDKKHNVLFTDKECLILSPKFKFVDEDLVILRAPRKNDVYSLDLRYYSIGGTHLKESRENIALPGTTQQNGVAERKNGLYMMLLENYVSRSFLPIQFWVKQSICLLCAYRVLVITSNEDPYDNLDGRGDPLTISEEGYLLGYSITAKDLDDQQFIVHTTQPMPPEERTAAKERFMMIKGSAFEEKQRREYPLQREKNYSAVDTPTRWSFEDLMQKEFKMSSMGELTFFLGLQVKQSNGGIFLSQDKYVKDILNKFDFRTFKAVLLHGSYKSLEKMKQDFKSLQRFLIYCCQKNLKKYNLGDVNILAEDSFLEMQNKTIVAISSTEAEYVAAASCCAQVLWMQNQLLDYGFNFMNTEIHIDNESTICIVKNPVFSLKKVRHIQIRHHSFEIVFEQSSLMWSWFHNDDNGRFNITKGFDWLRF